MPADQLFPRNADPLVMDFRAQAAGTRPRALLLDGDGDSRALIRGLLVRSGWSVATASTDPVALRARGVPPARAVIVEWPRLEWLWPHLLAAREAGGGAPYIVAVVAPDPERDALAALAAGADDCLVRPIRPADLAARLGVALRAGSERHRAREAAAAARRDRERIAAVLCSLPDGLVVLAPDATVLEANAAFCAMTGFARDDLVGRRSLFPDWPEEEGPALARLLETSAAGGAGEADVVLRSAGGGRFPAIVAVAPLHSAAGPLCGHIATVKDVSRRVRAERARGALQRVGSLTAAGAAAGSVLDRITAEMAALGAGARGLVLRGVGDAAVVASSSGGAPRGAPAPARSCPVLAPIHVAGEEWGAVAVSSDPGADLPEGLAEIAEAMAEHAATAVVDERARSLALGADPLTGLLGARAFSEATAREVERARRHGRPVCMVLVDIDGFRGVNEAHGTAAGDGLLREIARLMGEHVRSSDSLGRTGGDEFGWLLPEADEDAARDAAARLRRAVAETPLPGVGPVTVSLGVASAASATGAADLHRQAEVALHWAKVSGRDRAVVYAFAVAEEVFARHGSARAEAPSLRAMRALAWAVDAKDPHTHRHSARVADLAVQLATALGWPVPRAARLRAAGLVHDVGKIAVPDAILFKPGPLTADEWEQVTRHAEVGARIVADVLSPEQAAWVRGHHERWDGGGYPDGLAGEAIPEEARLLALADAWDVIVGARSYKAGRSQAEALEEVRRCSGGQFWPAAVVALERLVAAGALTVPSGGVPALPGAA